MKKETSASVKAKLKSLRIVSVRFDTSAKAWAILKNTETMEAKQIFLYGVMKNVKFSKYPVTEEIRHVCVPSTYKKSFVGVATGELFLNTEAKSMRGAKNLKFGEEGFLDFEEKEIKKARQLAMTPDRRALYWV